MQDVDRQMEVIKANTVELIEELEMRQRLKAGRPLRVKWGADPSAPDLHLGHLVVLRKLRKLQELGHKIIFLIGDFTARIGDPSGRSESRKPLSAEEIKKNAKTYKEQVFKILDSRKTEVVFNSKWLEKMNLSEVFKLASQYTVARMLERDDFANRYSTQRPISIHEFLYPLIQGYDSVELKADIEIGGTDQKFNLLMGRLLQKESGQTPQIVMTLPILEGLDGTQKMSKSLGNYIGFTEAPYAIFSKVMSISDEMMLKYYALLTDENASKIEAEIKSGKIHPKDAKIELAKYFVKLFYNTSEAESAAKKFDTVFAKREQPQDMELKTIARRELGLSGEIALSKLLCTLGLVPSNSEGRRSIKHGAVKVNEEKVTDENRKMRVADSEQVISLGKRKFVRVKLA